MYLSTERNELLKIDQYESQNKLSTIYQERRLSENRKI